MTFLLPWGSSAFPRADMLPSRDSWHSMAPGAPWQKMATGCPLGIRTAGSAQMTGRARFSGKELEAGVPGAPCPTQCPTLVPTGLAQVIQEGLTLRGDDHLAQTQLWEAATVRHVAHPPPGTPTRAAFLQGWHSPRQSRTGSVGDMMQIWPAAGTRRATASQGHRMWQARPHVVMGMSYRRFYKKGPDHSAHDTSGHTRTPTLLLSQPLSSVKLCPPGQASGRHPRTDLGVEVCVGRWCSGKRRPTCALVASVVPPVSVPPVSGASPGQEQSLHSHFVAPECGWCSLQKCGERWGGR